jgi:hypothetical protein
MCWNYDLEYFLARAAEAQKAMQEAEARMKQAKSPAAPAQPEAVEPGVKEPVPA